MEKLHSAPELSCASVLVLKSMDKSVKQDRYPLTYRATEMQQVMGWFKARQSGCLIGLRGSGKSNFLRFLLQESVRQYYLGQDYINYTLVLVNLLALTERTEWAVCEMIVARLLAQFPSLKIRKSECEELTLLQREVMHSRDLLTAYRAVERCVDVLCQRPTQRIVLIFDEFSTVFQTLEPSLFRCLRAIRDAHIAQVSYMVVLTNEMRYLRDDLNEVDHFYRLVSRNICYLGSYVEEDALHMIHYLASQRSTEWNEEDAAYLIKLSGGHPSLIKAVLNLLWNMRYEVKVTELSTTLKNEHMVQAECQKIWEGLSESEQAALCSLVSGMPVDPNVLRHLKRKRVIREDQLGDFLFSPLFTHFVHQQLLPSPISVVINVSPRVVRIGCRHIDNLTELEFEMLRYLYQHRDRVCTKNELIENVYKYVEGVSDEALQKLISRLRDKVESNRSRPSIIVTLREQGYLFVEPREP